MEVHEGFVVPTITEDDLRKFQEKHFPGTALPHVFFINDQAGEDINYEYEGEYDDDELGYYPDGVKRTLTETQISIFRHSELQRIIWREAGEYSGPIFPTRPKHGQLKSKIHSKDRSKARDNAEKPAEAAKQNETMTEGESEGREASQTPSSAQGAAHGKSKKKKKKKGPKKKTPGKMAYDASRVWKKEVERQEQLKRRNTSSPEPGPTPLDKRPRKDGLAREVGAEDAKGSKDRNDPEDFKSDGEEFTYRRLARDEDDVPNVSVDLDY